MNRQFHSYTTESQRIAERDCQRMPIQADAQKSDDVMWAGLALLSLVAAFAWWIAG